jgi:hypothetical protein
VDRCSLFVVRYLSNFSLSLGVMSATPLKKAILSCIFIFACNLLHAQSHRLEIGIETGLSSATVHGFLHYDIAGPTPGFSGSMTVQYALSDIFSLKTGIGYQQKGYLTIIPNVGYTDPKVETYPNGNIYNYFPESYLAVPLLAKASFGHNAKFFVNAGPYLALLLHASSISVYNYTAAPETETKDETYHYQNFDIGICWGLGINIPLKNKLTFEFETRYNRGFTNINNSKLYYNGRPEKFEGKEVSQTGLQNSTVDFLLGLRYRL